MDVGEYVEDFLRNAVREVALITLCRKIGKGEYCDGCGGRCRCHRRRFLCARPRATLGGSTAFGATSMLRLAVPPKEGTAERQQDRNDHELRAADALLSTRAVVPGENRGDRNAQDKHEREQSQQTMRPAERAAQ